MRDILLTSVVVGILPFALKHTWMGVLLWTWLSVMNPHKLAFGFAQTAPFALSAALVTFASVLVNRKILKIPKDLTVVALFLWVTWMCISTANSIHVDDSMTDLIAVLKIQLMTFVAFMAIRDRKHIEAFIWVIVISVGFYGFKGGIFTILTGGSGRVWGPPDTYINGNNEIGLALTMVIPLANYLRLVSPNKWVRMGLTVLMLLSAVAVLGTQSRGALLAIGAMTLVLWMRSSKKFVGGGVLLVLAAALLAFMPKSWEDRMSTIKTYEQDGSAMSRINAWEMAINLANGRITGGGFQVETLEVYQKFAPSVEWGVFTAHSIYFQALGEQGWPGLFLFLCVGAGAVLATVQVRSLSKGRPETRWAFELAGMVQVSMIGYATGGAFLSLSYLDLAYNVAVIIVGCKMWLKAQRWKEEPLGLFGNGVPLGSLAPPPKGGSHAF